MAMMKKRIRQSSSVTSKLLATVVLVLAASTSSWRVHATLVDVGSNETVSGNETIDALENPNSTLFEGDIVVDYDRIYSEYGASVADRLVDSGVVERPASRRELDAMTSDNYLWPRGDDDMVTIPYTFADDAFTAGAQSAIATWANNLASQTNFLKFVERTDETSYIRFIAGSGCYATVGYYSGVNTISLGSGCLIKGTVQHEILHSLGFWHEQSREDRDDYVYVNYDNIITSMQYNFDKRAARSFGSPYDYGSVMHYSKTAFSKNGKNTITPLESGVTIGQRTGLSEGDLLQLDILYQDPDTTWYPTQQPTPPTAYPTVSPTMNPNTPPTAYPTTSPTLYPTPKPTNAPTTHAPTKFPTARPTNAPTVRPTKYPTMFPTKTPTTGPTGPTPSPTKPTKQPTPAPVTPTKQPTPAPVVPTTSSPTTAPTVAPTAVCSTEDEQTWENVRPNALKDYSTLQSCAQNCTQDDDKESCIAECVEGSAGFTESCSECFAEFVMCVEDSCSCEYNETSNCGSQCSAVDDCDREFDTCTVTLTATYYNTDESGSSSTASSDEKSASMTMIGAVAGVGCAVAGVLAVSIFFVRRRRSRRLNRSTNPHGGDFDGDHEEDKSMHAKLQVAPSFKFNDHTDNDNQPGAPSRFANAMRSFRFTKSPSAEGSLPFSNPTPASSGASQAPLSPFAAAAAAARSRGQQNQPKQQDESGPTPSSGPFGASRPRMSLFASKPKPPVPVFGAKKSNDIDSKPQPPTPPFSASSNGWAQPAGSSFAASNKSRAQPPTSPFANSQPLKSPFFKEQPANSPFAKIKTATSFSNASDDGAEKKPSRFANAMRSMRLTRTNGNQANHPDLSRMQLAPSSMEPHRFKRSDSRDSLDV